MINYMKRSVVFFGISAVVLSLAWAPSALAKKEKTALFKDGVLKDLKYNYSLNVSSNWKVKEFKEPSVERAFLEKKNYSVNREVQTYGGDYTIPTVLIYVQEFNGSVGDFEALLKKSVEEHQSNNEVISKLGLLVDGEFVISGDVAIDSTRARQVILKRNYKRLLSADAYGRSTRPTDQPERYINDHEVHEIYLIKKDSLLYIIQAFSEREFYQENKVEFDALILSLKL